MYVRNSSLLVAEQENPMRDTGLLVKGAGGLRRVGRDVDDCRE